MVVERRTQSAVGGDAAQDHRGRQSDDCRDQHGADGRGRGQAGRCSVRSVFQHFGDVESLFVTVFDNVRERLRGAAAEPATRPLAARVHRSSIILAEMFDKVVPLRVAAGQFGDTNRPWSSGAWPPGRSCATLVRGLCPGIRRSGRGGPGGTGRRLRGGAVARFLDHAAPGRRAELRAGQGGVAAHADGAVRPTAPRSTTA